MHLLPILGGIRKRVLRQTTVQTRVGAGHSTRYCYSVWLRHLKYLHANGAGSVPDTVAELGPGDSLGVGLAALLTGSRRYYAFDVERAAASTWNLPMVNALVELLKNRSPIPDQFEFPEVYPILGSYEFPSEILTSELLARSLAPERVAAIRNAEINPGQCGSVEIHYRVPWVDEKVIEPATVDLVFSQAVLEHVDDLETCYRAIAAWLKPGGYSSHQIDLSSHDLADEWNGHWACSLWTWDLVRSGLPYLVNRKPCSAHLQLLARNNLVLVTCVPLIRNDGLKRHQLNQDFQHVTEDDLKTAGAYLLSRKSAGIIKAQYLVVS